MSDNWLKQFEEKFNLILFQNNEKGISYFEKQNSYTWFVKVDENQKTISLPKLISESFRERGAKEKEIVTNLLENINQWELIGLSNLNGEFEILKLETSDYNNVFYYSEKESLNAFGGKEWNEF